MRKWSLWSYFIFIFLNLFWTGFFTIKKGQALKPFYNLCFHSSPSLIVLCDPLVSNNTIVFSPPSFLTITFYMAESFHKTCSILSNLRFLSLHWIELSWNVYGFTKQWQRWTVIGRIRHCTTWLYVPFFLRKSG